MSVVYSTSYTSENFFPTDEDRLLNSSPTHNETIQIENLLYISYLEGEVITLRYDIVLEELKHFFIKKETIKLLYNLVVKDLKILNLQKMSKRYRQGYEIYKNLIIED